MEKNLDKMKPPYSEHIDSVFALHYMEVPLEMQKIEFFFFFSFLSFQLSSMASGVIGTLQVLL